MQRATGLEFYYVIAQHAKYYTYNSFQVTSITIDLLNSENFKVAFAQLCKINSKIHLKYCNKVTTARPKVKSRSDHDVAHLHPLTNIPTKYQLPTPYGFQDIARTKIL